MRGKDFWVKYRRVLSSKAWKDLKANVIEKNASICMHCLWEWPQERLDLHHLHYKNLGRETEDDVALLCNKCHDILDSERESESRRRSREALFNAQLDAWATKIYGEDWFMRYDEERVEEDFIAWLEARGDVD